jgi:hypothetical protein
LEKNPIYNESTFYDFIRRRINYSEYKIKRGLEQLRIKELVILKKISISELSKIDKYKDMQFQEDQIKVLVDRRKLKKAYINWKESLKIENEKLISINNEINDFKETKYPKFISDNSTSLLREQSILEYYYDNNIESIDFEIKSMEEKIKELQSEKKRIENEYKIESNIIKEKIDSFPKENDNENRIKEYYSEFDKLYNKKYKIEEILDGIDFPDTFIQEGSLTFNTFGCLQFVKNKVGGKSTSNDISYLLLLLFIAKGIRKYEEGIWISQKKLQEIFQMSDVKIKTGLDTLKDCELIYNYQYYPECNKTFLSINGKNIIKASADFKYHNKGKLSKDYDHSFDKTTLEFLSSRISKETKVPKRKKSNIKINNDERINEIFQITDKMI